MRAASRRYLGKNCDLQHLAESIEEHFQVQGYQTQNAKKDAGWVVQARKEGALRDIIAADRAFTITVSGNPTNFTVAFGIGKWAQNLGFAVVEGLVLSPMIFFIEVPVSLWSYEIEREFWHFVEQQVELRV